MPLPIPSHKYETLKPDTGQLRYAGTLCGLDLDGHIAFRSITGGLVLGELRQLSYQGAYVTLSYIPLFSEWKDGNDYAEIALLGSDYVWVFHPADIEEVIALRSELSKQLTNKMATGD
jgi:hypothetical protein